MKRITAMAILLLVTLASAHAQDSVITNNPKIVTLREIWRIRGSIGGQEYIGLATAAISDVNGDGIDEVAVLTGRSGAWEIYYGGDPAPDFEPELLLRGYHGIMFTGDFWGTGHKAVGVPLDSCDQFSRCYFRPRIFPTDAGFIDTAAGVFLPTDSQFCKRIVRVADLDSDGADELIFTGSCYDRDIRIYKGGLGFPGLAPTLRITDPDMSTDAYDFFGLVTGDFDGDRRLDMVTSGRDRSGNTRLKFYWGSPTSPWSWTQPDRVVDLWKNSEYNEDLDAADVDGDGVTDLLRQTRGVHTGTCLFRSRKSGFDPRGRSYLFEDADKFWNGTYRIEHAGYVTDSTHRYESILLFQGDSAIVFSGGANGPDLKIDATYRDGLGTVFNTTAPVGDVSGDGWDDIIASNPDWYLESWHMGIALILAGGPYIPRDDTTLAIRDVELEGKERALSLWPNPMRDELNVAWRGDLARMPRRFEVHDAAGRRVAAGDIEQGVGAALWRCAHVPAGAYFLSIFDSHGVLLATERIVKE